MEKGGGGQSPCLTKVNHFLQWSIASQIPLSFMAFCYICLGLMPIVSYQPLKKYYPFQIPDRNYCASSPNVVLISLQHHHVLGVDLLPSQLSCSEYERAVHQSHNIGRFAVPLLLCKLQFLPIFQVRIFQQWAINRKDACHSLNKEYIHISLSALDSPEGVPVQVSPKLLILRNGKNYEHESSYESAF